MPDVQRMLTTRPQIKTLSIPKVKPWEKVDIGSQATSNQQLNCSSISLLIWIVLNTAALHRLLCSAAYSQALFLQLSWQETLLCVTHQSAPLGNKLNQSSLQVILHNSHIASAIGADCKSIRNGQILEHLPPFASSVDFFPFCVAALRMLLMNCAFRL
jgi:hypothetical protein